MSDAVHVHPGLLAAAHEALDVLSGLAAQIAQPGDNLYSLAARKLETAIREAMHTASATGAVLLQQELELRSVCEFAAAGWMTTELMCVCTNPCDPSPACPVCETRRILTSKGFLPDLQGV